MKKLLLFWAAVVLAAILFLPFAQAQSPFDTTFIFGGNWFPMNVNVLMFDTSFHCNLYHAHNDLGDSTFGAAIKSTSRVAYDDGGPIYYYSGAYQFIYQALPKTDKPFIDTTKQYVFLSRDTSTGDTSGLYWQINKDVSGTHADDKVLWNNEFTESWRSPTIGPFKLAVRLHVLTPPDSSVDSAENVISIVLKEQTDSTHDTTLYTYSIPWANCSTQDYVFIDTDAIHVPWAVPILDGYDSLPYGMQVEVHTKRYVTTFIKWVTLEDLYADTLLSVVNLDTAAIFVPPNTPYMNAGYTYAGDTMKVHVADALIFADSALIYKRFDTTGNKKLYAFYLDDEPTMAQYAATGRVNALLKGRGQTERQNTQYKRYIAQVQPTLFWQGGGFGAEANQVSADLDSAIAGYVAPDSTLLSGAACYSDTIQRKYISDQYGYFPVDTSTHKIVSDSEYAQYTKTNHPHCAPSGYFDDFDVREGGFNNDQVSAAFGAAAICDSAVYFAPPSGITPPKEWIANIFTEAKITTNAGMGGYYTTATAPTPEQLSCISNIALACGSHGLLFFPPVSYDSCDIGANDMHICTGFLDTNNTYTSNYTTVMGNTLPAQYKNRTNWLQSFGAWLAGPARELRTKKFLGAFCRYTAEHFTGGVYSTSFFAQTIGNDTIIVPSKDSSTRPIIKHWPSVGLSYHKITSMADTLVKDTNDAELAGDSLCLLTYGVFQDTVAAQAGKTVLYLYTVNDYCDPRTLLCTYDPDSSGYIKRGERTIWTQLNLNPKTSIYWKITTLDSTKADTILAYNARFRAHFLPGEGKIFKIEVANGITAGTGEITWNNSRKIEFSPTTQRWYVTYSRSDSVFLRRSLPNDYFDWESEVLVAPDTVLFPHGIWQSNWNASHPSLRLIHTQIDSSGGVHQRTGIGITYDISVPGSPGQFYIVLKELAWDSLHHMPSGGRYQGNYWTKSVTITSFSQFGQSYTPTPVIAPFYDASNDYGAVVSWAGKYVIGAAAVNMTSGTFGVSTPFFFTGHTSIVSPDADTNEVFPSIIELTDTTTSTSPNVNSLGVAFQSWEHIFFAPLKVTGTGSGGNTVDTSAKIEHISYLTGDCFNDHPCIDLCRMRYPGITTYPAYHITWDADQHVLVSQSKGTFVDTRYIWEAMQNQWGGNWQYYVFGIQSGTAQQDNLKHVRKYQYPSIRAYDGDTTVGGFASLYLRSVEIGWYDDSGYVHYARDSNSSAYNAKYSFTDFKPGATNPNLDIQTHALSSFNTAHAAYETPSPTTVDVHDLSGTENPNRDSVLSWIRIQAAPKDSNTCMNDNYIWSALPINFTNTNHLATIISPPLVHISPGVTLNDILLKGTVALSDTVVMPSSIPSPYIATIAGLGWTMDSVTRASWLGAGGKVKYYLDVLNANTDAKLATLDSITITATTLAARFDTLHIALSSSYAEDTIFLAIRYAFTGTIDSPATNVSWFVGVQDTTPYADSNSTLAKDLHYAGRAGYVPMDNPLMLTVAPNPVHSEANVAFTIADVEDAQNTTECIVFDMMGKTVATLAKDQLTLGQHSVTFNATNLPSGSYIVAVHTTNHMESKLMVLTK